MSEINKIPHIIINNTDSVTKNTAKNPELNNEVKETVQNTLTDNGILGKSQVLKPDNITSDIEFCLNKSPEFLGKCDTFFETALKSFETNGIENSYEKACLLSKEFANEFS